MQFSYRYTSSGTKITLCLREALKGAITFRSVRESDVDSVTVDEFSYLSDWFKPVTWVKMNHSCSSESFVHESDYTGGAFSFAWTGPLIFLPVFIWSGISLTPNLQEKGITTWSLERDINDQSKKCYLLIGYNSMLGCTLPFQQTRLAKKYVEIWKYFPYVNQNYF